jgi:cytochrome c oxidase assembly protein subunit 11
MVDATRRRMTGLMLGGVVAGMGGMAYAAVPLYRIFCQVTGFGGTTRRAHFAPTQILDRVVSVRFDTGVGRGMPWHFQPVQREMAVRVGELAIATFTATNATDQVMMGTAAFNVTPQKAGPYFNKLQCFCFTEQILGPRETAELPVQFFVDPSMDEDRNLDDVATITLSYTFFEREMDAQARENYRLSYLSRRDVEPRTRTN